MPCLAIMDLETLALFVLVETLASLTPGPAVLLVVGLSIRFGFRLGLAATLGILATNALYFSLAALGIGAAILASATLFTIIKWLGAAYLIYLGCQLLRPLLARLSASPDINPAVEALDHAGAANRRMRPAPWRAFGQGFGLQASNPKNIAFFVAILPQFVTPEGHVALQLAILGVVSVLLELPILVAYGWAAHRLTTVAPSAWMTGAVVDWIEGMAGSLLIAMGVALGGSGTAGGIMDGDAAGGDADSSRLRAH